MTVPKNILILLSLTAFVALSDVFGAGLLKLGLTPGDRVAIWGHNSWEWIVAYIAAAKAGFLVVPLSPLYQAADLTSNLNMLGVKCLIYGEPWKNQHFYNVLLKILPELSTSSDKPFESAISNDRPHKLSPQSYVNVPSLQFIISLQEEYSPSPSHVSTFDDVNKIGDSEPALEKLLEISGKIQFDDVFYIKMTSGTTGPPKPAMLTHHNYINCSYAFSKRFNMNSYDKICLTVSLYHGFGTIAGIAMALHFGLTLVCPAPTYCPEATIKTTSNAKCTVMYGTPSMFSDLLNSKSLLDNDVRSLRIALTAGAPASVELLKKIKIILGVNTVFTAYGQTECGLISQSFSSDPEEILCETVGYPLENLEVKIIDPKTNSILPVGVPGELLYRGFGIMRGYWNDEKRTKDTSTEMGWRRTGDILTMTESGHLKFVGRMVDMISRGDETLFPKEVEEILYGHPDIVEAHVFGLPDPELGEVIAAWIRLKNDSQLTVQWLKEFCKGKISPTKIPLHIKFTDSFPKTASGKVPKFELRNLYAKELKLEGPTTEEDSETTRL